MTPPSSPKSLLKQIAQIRHMERGKLCLMRQGPGGPYYSHQTWLQGRNVVRYVRPDQVRPLQTAIAGYQTYVKLTQAYADLIIVQTRREQAQCQPTPPEKTKLRTPQNGKLRNTPRPMPKTVKNTPKVKI